LDAMVRCNKRTPSEGGPSRLSAVIALAACACLVALCGPAGCGSAKQSGRMKVSATIWPLADFARNVGGDLVDVQVLIPGGANPHTFEPTTSQLAFLSESKVMVTNGLHLETWVSSVVKKVGKRGMVLVVTSNAIPRDLLLKAGSYNGEKGTPGAPYDPHVWLDPTIASYQVNAIRDGLIEADPANEAAYTKNAAEYNDKLAALDREITGMTSKFKSRNFVALHPGWSYFSRRYRVNQAGAVEEFPEQEPSGRQVADIVKKIKDLHIKVIFAEPQISAKAAQVIASEIPGVRVLVIDPLGNPSKPDVSTYIKMMKHDVSVMSEALR
jgi:zinc transport system substrate-binding protein